MDERVYQHNIGYTANSIKVLKEMRQRTKQTTKTTKYTYARIIIETKKDIHSKSPSLH